MHHISRRRPRTGNYRCLEKNQWRFGRLGSQVWIKYSWPSAWGVRKPGFFNTSRFSIANPWAICFRDYCMSAPSACVCFLDWKRKLLLPEYRHEQKLTSKAKLSFPQKGIPILTDKKLAFWRLVGCQVARSFEWVESQLLYLPSSGCSFKYFWSPNQCRGSVQTDSIALPPELICSSVRGISAIGIISPDVWILNRSTSPSFYLRTLIGYWNFGLIQEVPRFSPGPSTSTVCLSRFHLRDL